MCQLTFLLSRLLLSILGCTRKREPLHLDMPDINLASFAINKGQSGLHRVMGHANFSRPDISSTTRNDANDTLTPPGIHHAIEDLIQRPIATVAYDQVVVCFSCPGCQFHTVPAVLLNGNVGTPTSCR